MGFNWPANWKEVPLLQRVENKTVFFKDGRWVTTLHHDLSGRTASQLFQKATAWWKAAAGVTE